MQETFYTITKHERVRKCVIVGRAGRAVRREDLYIVPHHPGLVDRPDLKSVRQHRAGNVEMQDGETEHKRGAAGEECSAFATNSGMGR